MDFELEPCNLLPDAMIERISINSKELQRSRRLSLAYENRKFGDLNVYYV